MSSPQQQGGGGSGAPQAAPRKMSVNFIKDLTRKYGRVALAVHFTVYFSFWFGCYVALEKSVDVRGTLEHYGLLSAKTYDETANEAPEERGWLDRTLSGGGSSVALAFLCNKALFPVRTPITVGLTPVVARYLQRMRAARVPPP